MRYLKSLAQIDAVKKFVTLEECAKAFVPNFKEKKEDKKKEEPKKKEEAKKKE